MVIKVSEFEMRQGPQYTCKKTEKIISDHFQFSKEKHSFTHKVEILFGTMHINTLDLRGTPGSG